MFKHIVGFTISFLLNTTFMLFLLLDLFIGVKINDAIETVISADVTNYFSYLYQ